MSDSREVGPSWPLPVGLVCELTELCVGAGAAECMFAEIGDSPSSWALFELPEEFDLEVGVLRREGGTFSCTLRALAFGFVVGGGTSRV